MNNCYDIYKVAVWRSSSKIGLLMTTVYLWLKPSFLKS
jgi:hypothetical protein